MRKGFQLLPTGIEEGRFKRVPEGWLFTASNPWIIGPRRTYLVSDAQKTAIATRVRRAAYVRLIVIVPMMFLVAAALVLYPSLKNPTSLEEWTVLGALVVAMGVAVIACDNRALRSALRGLPRTSQKVRLREALRNQAEAMSIRSLAIVTIGAVIGALGVTYITFARPSVLGTIIAIIVAVSAVVYFWMVTAKLSKRSPD
jgi:hypothetical protein